MTTGTHNTPAGNETRDKIAGIHERLDPLDGQALVHMACAMMLRNQRDLSIGSGISPTTITQLNKGKRATKSQRAAIYWAVLCRIA